MELKRYIEMAHNGGASFDPTDEGIDLSEKSVSDLEQKILPDGRVVWALDLAKAEWPEGDKLRGRGVPSARVGNKPGISGKHK